MPAKAAAGTAAVVKARPAGALKGGTPAPPLLSLTRESARLDTGFPGTPRSIQACDSVRWIIVRKGLARCWTNDQLVASGCLPILHVRQ